MSGSEGGGAKLSSGSPITRKYNLALLLDIFLSSNLPISYTVKPVLRGYPMGHIKTV